MTQGSKIWRLCDPRDATFARVIRNGYWYSGHEETDPMTLQLIIEWKRAGALAPDFLWPGYDDDIVVASDIGLELHQSFKGFKFVDVIQKGRPPRKRSVKQDLQAKLLRCEPREYKILWINAFVNCDKVNSTFVKKVEPDGYTKTVLDGIEHVELEWIPEEGVLLRKRIPREESKGLLIRRRALGKNAVFRVRQWPIWMMCTQEVKDFIEKNKYTNIGFEEIGNVL